jgi:hypothetical protein
MSIYRTWHLPERIEALSTTRWPQAAAEWRLRSITMLDPGDESASCLCGHTPIRELCRIQNRINQNETIVGNHCIQQFSKDSEGESVFSAIPRIFQACQRILEDVSHSANPELIEHAHRKGVFNDWEAQFYNDTWRKRSLSASQEAIKTKLNTRLIHLVILSPRKAYHRLVANPTQSTGPDVFNRAHDQKILTDREWRFYRNIWDHFRLSETDRIERNRLNRKIIAGLQGQMAAS